MVRVVRREIENIAGADRPFSLRLEAAQNFERRTVDEREIALIADLPAAHPRALQQDHIVTVEMRADAAAGHGVAHHHVVLARVRHEAEVLLQRASRRDEILDSVDEQRPVARRQPGEIATAERSVLHPPRSARADDQPRFDVIAAGEADQARAVDCAVQLRQDGARKEGFFLPVFCEEAPRSACAKEIKSA